MRPVLSLLVLTLLVAAFAPAVAQSHSHDGEARLLVRNDGPESGRAIVGGHAILGWALLNPEDAVQRHKDGELSLTLDGLPLFSSPSLHDYDGVVTFETTWWKPGHYVLEASIPDGPDATIEGFVEPVSFRDSRFTLEGPSSVPALTLAQYAYEVRWSDEDEAIPHADVLLEVRRLRDDALVLRVPTHAHHGQHEVAFSLEEPGDYLLRFTAYQSWVIAERDVFKPFIHEETLRVTSPIPGAPVAASPSGPDAREPGKHAGSGQYALHLTYDPELLVGPSTPLRAGLVVHDVGEDVLLKHVDHAVLVTGPAGRIVLDAPRVHAYGGVQEIVSMNAMPGEYVLDVVSTFVRDGNEWNDEQRLAWRVAPPVVAAPVVSGAGAYAIHVDGLDSVVAGEPASAVFTIANAAGVPLAHADLEVAVHSTMEEPPLYRAKLHTHGDGKFVASMAFPEEGTYHLRFDAWPLMPSPVTVHLASDPLSPRILALDVAPGLPIETHDDALDLENDDVMAVPGLAAPLAAFAFTAAAVAAARRRQ